MKDGLEILEVLEILEILEILETQARTSIQIKLI